MIRYKCRGGFAPVSFSDIAPFVSHHPRFIILDRDGSLVPYNAVPERAVLPPTLKALLCHLAGKDKDRVAVVSARGLAGLRQEFDPDKHILAGNYGMEISYPSGRSFLHPVAKEAAPHMAALAEDMLSIKTTYPRLILDNHTYSLCLHYHQLPGRDQKRVSALIESLERRYHTLRFRRLPTSHEVVPMLDWDKGHALDQISMELGLEGEDILYLTIGDTASDEPMYKWVNSRGGLSFNVGKRKDSQAQGYFDTCRDVHIFLANLLDAAKPGPGVAIL